MLSQNRPIYTPLSFKSIHNICNVWHIYIPIQLCYNVVHIVHMKQDISNWTQRSLIGHWKTWCHQLANSGYGYPDLDLAFLDLVILNPWHRPTFNSFGLGIYHFPFTTNSWIQPFPTCYASSIEFISTPTSDTEIEIKLSSVYTSFQAVVLVAAVWKLSHLKGI